MDVDVLPTLLVSICKGEHSAVNGDAPSVSTAGELTVCGSGLAPYCIASSVIQAHNRETTCVSLSILSQRQALPCTDKSKDTQTKLTLLTLQLP